MQKMGTRRTHAGVMHKVLPLGLLLCLIGLAGWARLEEGRCRSKLAQARTDMKRLAVALEAYRVEWNYYPASYAIGNEFGTTQLSLSLSRLTTPVPYLRSVELPDPFGEDLTVNSGRLYQRPMLMYFNYEPVDPSSMTEWAQLVAQYGPEFRNRLHKAFMIWSPGPDRNDNNVYWGELMDSDKTFTNLIYDPSNGTISLGDLGLTGGDSRTLMLPFTR